MSLHPQWPELLLRLALTVVAGAAIGLNRGEHGQSAGLRTTLLVCLAASLSMIQVNLLLDLSGKAANSFVVLDLMRLPLGILSGMGFIGAGAILHRENVVSGVTTAATLWFVTVMGLCFGAGQIALGLIALALALFILIVLKHVEKWLKHDECVSIRIRLATFGPAHRELAHDLEARGLRIGSWRVLQRAKPAQCEVSFNVQWRRSPNSIEPPVLIDELMNRPGIMEIEWSA